VNLGYPVFIDDGGGGDNWSYKSCKAPVKSSPGFHLGLEKRGNATPHVCKKGVELPIANEKKG